MTILIKSLVRTFTLFVAGWSLSVSAQSAVNPAQFGDALQQIAAQVNLPSQFEGGHKAIAVYCQTDVLVTGALQSTECYEYTNVADLKQQTLKALQGATFEPATVNGEAVPVRMQFRVVYSPSADQPDVVMLPNLGTLQKEHGVDYFAPQERLDQPTWYESYAKNSWAEGRPFFNEGRLTRVMGSVTTEGKVERVDTLEARGRGKRDAQYIEAALPNSQFIPGFVNDTPTKMHYVAVLNYAQ